MRTKLGFMMLLFSLVMGKSFAQTNLFAPSREGKSNYVTDKSLKDAQKLPQKEVLIDTLDKVLNDQSTNISLSDYQVVQDSIEEFLSRELGKKYQTVNAKRRHNQRAYNLLRGQDLIDDVFYRLISDYNAKLYPSDNNEARRERDLKGPKLSLKDDLTKKKLIQRSFARMSKVPEETVAADADSPFPIKKYKTSSGEYKNLSVREKIYFEYSMPQILQMAQIIDLALNVADAKNVFTTIEFRNGDGPMVIDHSPTEQYRLAVRIMRMKKAEAESDSSKIGQSTDDIDLIAAAYEMGIISYEEISLIVHNKDFYLPQISFARKAVGYIGGLASLTLRVHPATAPYVLLPMMLYNSYMQVQNSSKVIDEESFYFNLPKRN